MPHTHPPCRKRRSSFFFFFRVFFFKAALFRWLPAQARAREWERKKQVAKTLVSSSSPRAVDAILDSKPLCAPAEGMCRLDVRKSSGSRDLLCCICFLLGDGGMHASAQIVAALLRPARFAFGLALLETRKAGQGSPCEGHAMHACPTRPAARRARWLVSCIARSRGVAMRFCLPLLTLLLLCCCTRKTPRN